MGEFRESMTLRVLLSKLKRTFPVFTTFDVPR